jgi:uroporphyrin-III C-methyltransferase
MTISRTNTVYLVGAGPGAPDLITLRAARLLEAADIVFHDALVHPDTVALATRAEKVAVGKRYGQYSAAQHFINKRLIDAARKYQVVVRLKGGDPMLFGRAQEEIDALGAAGIACEVVPGITAALAASADTRISLTRRGISRSVAFATPRVGRDEQPSDWAGSLLNADTGVLYMAAHEAAGIAAQLIARGKAGATPVMVVENASLGGQRHVTTLAGLARDGLPAFAGPALMMLGEVYREALDSAESQTTSLAAAAQQRC